MSSTITKIIRDTISTIKERNLILTPDNYTEVFCEVAKKNGYVSPDCQKLEKYLSRLNEDLVDQLKQKRVKNIDELFAFMSAKLNSSNINELTRLIHSLVFMSKRILQAVTVLHNKEAKKLAELSIDTLSKKLDISSIDLIRDKWFEFLTDYDDLFIRRLGFYGVKSFDDLQAAVTELDNASIRSGDTIHLCQKIVHIIVCALAPSISESMNAEIAGFELSLKNDPKLLEADETQDNIQKLIKRRIELDRAEISSKVSVLNDVLEGINTRLLNMMSSSSTSGAKMQDIKKDLNSINLKEDGFESIRDKLIIIAESLGNETEQFSLQVSSDQKRIKELQDRISSLEGELAMVKAESKEDFLTKTATKRALMEELDRMEDKYRRYNIDYSLCFFDIDYFKKINDTYGHDAGDVIIASIGKILKKYSRKVDFVARYGGEEFVMLLPQSSLVDSVNFANKIRDIIENSKFMYKDERIDVTISCGVTIRSSNKSSSSTLEYADKMLYIAKQNGRNQVVPNMI
ncbi:GGDEF domain-containing protein [Campylobacter sp. RM16192]|uniref:GGDEF domain-containing protein n=1 Tax=Campylobacter sp. RM16192 TaxID=1660080 RepID=UPI00145226FF|nr:GGDEF domain-containing protein [Campylobacter sp. RM16192]QCD52301.1 diguanylate cyclase [Campylobacter sp. RM16192]